LDASPDKPAECAANMAFKCAGRDFLPGGTQKLLTAGEFNFIFMSSIFGFFSGCMCWFVFSLSWPCAR
jgi:hypothetical protein